MSERMRVNVLLMLIILAAFAVRVYRLDYFAFRGDESFTVNFSALPADQLWEGIRSLEPNPPLYYYALRGWMAVVGQSEFAARFFSLFFGVLMVPLIFVLARALGGMGVGVLAAALVAISPFAIYHSQDVRNYTIWPSLTMLAGWFLWRALRHGRGRDWLGYTATSLLTLYAHYFTLFVLVADNLFAAGLLVSRNLTSTAYAKARRRFLATWVIVQSVLALGFLVWLSIGSSNMLASYRSGTAPDLDNMARVTFQALLIGDSIPKNQVLWLMLLPVALIAAGSFFMLRRNPWALFWLLAMIVVPFTMLYFITRARPLYEPRYLIMMMPALYILAASGLAGLASRRRWRVAAVVGASAWLIIAVYAYGQAQFNPRFAKSPDWRARAAYLEANQQPGDVIVHNYPDPSFAYYYRGAAPFRLIPTGYLDDQRRAETLSDLQDLLAHQQRMWLFPQKDANWDYDGTVEKWLTHKADRVWRGSVYGMSAQIYETPAAFMPNLQPLNIVFSDSVKLSGYRLGSETAQPGAPLELVLYWQTSDRVSQDYNVFTHLLNAAGAVVAQQDNAPAQGTYPTSQWQASEIIVDAYEIALPADLPPGDYPLEVGLYDWTTGVRLKTEAGDDRVLLPVKVHVK